MHTYIIASLCADPEGLVLFLSWGKESSSLIVVDVNGNSDLSYIPLSTVTKLLSL